MCDIATVLDPSSATELLSMYPIDDFENKQPTKMAMQSTKYDHIPTNLNNNYPLQANLR